MRYLKLFRFSHWAENLFLYAPLFFAGKIFNLSKVIELFIAFLSFSLVAGSFYIISGYVDIKANKMNTAENSKALSLNVVIVLSVLCLVVGVFLAWLVHPGFIIIISIYLLLIILYSFGLKNISILDIAIIAIGFLLRIKAGGIVSGVPISVWLMVMVFLLALFIALAKKRDDILIEHRLENNVEAPIKGYNLELINVMLALISAAMIIAYLIYTMDPVTIAHFKTSNLYYTGIFVISGLLRYLQITYVENTNGTTAKILYKDLFIQVSIILWIASFYIIIYLPKDKGFFS